MEKSDRSMQDLKPTVWIGKSGCSETMIGEIKAQLKKRKVVKVKWLQSTDIDPQAIAARTGATLVEVRGRTLVLAEKGRDKGKR
ncbi:MAG: RNA-binding protein YhbY [Methanoregula sp. PtaU1.Bin051]|nr:MAG: RNA-binding protein YhbY [Methanoregula sp. PtaU1.Bin051]